MKIWCKIQVTIPILEHSFETHYKNAKPLKQKIKKKTHELVAKLLKCRILFEDIFTFYYRDASLKILHLVVPEIIVLKI